MTDRISYESHILDSIHHKANTAKNECFFVGFLDGVLANERLDLTEVEPLLAECAAICRQVGDDDAAEILAEASAGHGDTPKVLLETIAQIAEIRSEKIDPACRRSNANRLLGFCAGVNCDGIVTRREARVLYDRLGAAHDLDDDPRVVSLRHVVLDALEDDLIDEAESAEISQLITTLVGDSYADTGIPSSETLPVIHDIDEIDETILDGSRVVLTGRFSFGSRGQVSDRLQEYGAILQSVPTRKTDIVLIGSEGSPNYAYKHHGGKLAKALTLRSTGPAPRLYTEPQLRIILR
ncbi:MULTISPECIES: hypothetical protein [Marinovum]|uniref:hypothetical protein n=1 Tax=Marinovum TaxID=367771 RepID=UPI00237AD201|nr:MULTISPECIES: hypothetical protein [Marinovum]MDD9746645.1 hypothetical protein [Marinovum sp. PR37]